MGKENCKPMNMIPLKATDWNLMLGTITYICFLSCEWKSSRVRIFSLFGPEVLWGHVIDCHLNACLLTPHFAHICFFLCVVLLLIPWMDSVQWAFQQPFTKTVQTCEPNSLDGASLILLKLLLARNTGMSLEAWVMQLQVADMLCARSPLVLLLRFWESSIGLTWDEISFKSDLGWGWRSAYLLLV